MRVIFSADTPVDLKDLPKTAYGHVNLRPGEDGSMGHYFPKGRQAEVPDALAETFIASGVAKQVVGQVIIFGEGNNRPDEVIEEMARLPEVTK